MPFERRDFLKLASVGLTVGWANPGLQSAGASAAGATGEFEGGTGSLHLEGRLKSGTLDLHTHDFVQGKDRAVISHGTFGSTNPAKFYCAMFSHYLDHTVFAVVRDEDHSTTLIFSDSEVPEIGRLIVWHDVAAAQTFQIKKEDFLENGIIVDVNNKHIDFTGKRKPPDFTTKELDGVFGNDPALLKFMRGKRAYRDSRADSNLDDWICRLLSKLPGSIWGLFWAAR